MHSVAVVPMAWGNPTRYNSSEETLLEKEAEIEAGKLRIWFILVAWAKRWGPEFWGKENLCQWRRDHRETRVLSVRGPLFCLKETVIIANGELWGAVRFCVFSLLCCWWIMCNSLQFQWCVVWGLFVFFQGLQDLGISYVWSFLYTACK